MVRAEEQHGASERRVGFSDPRIRVVACPVKSQDAMLAPISILVIEQLAKIEQECSKDFCVDVCVSHREVDLPIGVHRTDHG